MDARALDFWLGDWRCSWDGGEGSNSITRELDDAVVIERFEARGDDPFSGMSVSVFDEEAGWRQTWVDSNGSYWHSLGSTLGDGGGFVFATPEPVDAGEEFKRMVFSHITPDAFDWRWESSAYGERWRNGGRSRTRAGPAR